MSFSAQAWPLPLLLVLSLALGVYPSPAENESPSVTTLARSDSSIPDSTARTTSDKASLKGDARILHALDRLTFGPRGHYSGTLLFTLLSLKSWVASPLSR